jgi:hypothetical protein
MQVGVATWFGSWLLLAGLQAAALNVFGHLDLWVWLVVVALQVAKLPIAIARARDAGEPADVALLTLVPVLSVLSWLRGFRARGKGAVARGAEAEGMDGVEAYGNGLSLALRSATAVAPVTLLFAALGAAFALGFVDAMRGVIGTETGALIESGAYGVCGFLALYFLVQSGKRATASRVSWLPTVLLLPSILLAIPFQLLAMRFPQADMIVNSLWYTAAYLSWAALGGGWLHAFWIAAAQQVEERGSADIAEAASTATQRWGDVAVIHGTKAQVVALGAQVVIPGIFYAIHWCFGEIAAMLDPEAPSLRRSGTVARAIRGRLFRMLAASFGVAQVLAMLGVWAIDGLDGISAFYLDATEGSFAAALWFETVAAFTTWIYVVSLLPIYRQRVDLLRRKAAERRAATEPAPVTESISSDAQGDREG